MFAQKMHGFELVHVQTKAWFPLVNVNKKLWKDPPFLMGKSTISMAMFNSFLYVYQKVFTTDISEIPNYPLVNIHITMEFIHHFIAG